MGGSDEEKEKERKRDIVGEFLKKNLTKGELALKHAAGLGSQPNAVPVTEPVVDGPLRPVEVGWHPVGGFAGKWFAEETGLGKMITEKINKYPDPTQHWAVLVGDYAHQLWMLIMLLKDENFDVIYTNAKIIREEWQTFSVGETRFNDDALRRAGESVIQSIREKQPAYNLITNNCQTYVLQLLDAIKVGVNKEFGTTLAVYERVFGPGKIKDLFEGEQRPEGQAQIEPGTQAGTQMHPGRSDTVNFAQDVMNQNTNQLDTEREMERHEDEKKDKKKKKGFFSHFKRG
ncbi:pppde peptidase protein [Fusarium austroafricanum]|uniref:Pppde peptidase protein n=1 Tax=Fusarium austroafricanum TaxID=2364996 RepID=A0A8H4KI65_9HYPO|nr:pppde peptidase protein [Fusarium austroafricanum]